jgi:16S rRNA (cytosine1402-N4)-methyltransferase
MPQSQPGKRQPHAPVMVREVLSLLVHDPDGIYVDCTLGCGGHAAAILGKLSRQGRLIGLDKDKDSFLVAGENLTAFGERASLFNRDFRELPDTLAELSLRSVSGILFDLGISSFQLNSERGFSFQKESPLDMRFDPARGATAAELLSTVEERRLAEIFRVYGDVRNANRLARLIVEFRKRRPILTTFHLVSAVQRAISPKTPRGSFARVFQALRIAVNDELEAVREGLRSCTSWLSPQGRLCVIAYHSGEDRIVKQFMRETLTFADGVESKLEVLTRKPLRPGRDEVLENPRSRSARLRAARRS